MADRLADFQDPLQSILRVLGDEDIPHVLIGGLAVSQLGRPRLTADIDVLAYIEDDARIQPLLQRASRSGFSPRIGDAEEFAAALELPEILQDLLPLLPELPAR
jgi:hypothetical protein